MINYLKQRLPICIIYIVIFSFLYVTMQVSLTNASVITSALR